MEDELLPEPAELPPVPTVEAEPAPPEPAAEPPVPTVDELFPPPAELPPVPSVEAEPAPPEPAAEPPVPTVDELWPPPADEPPVPRVEAEPLPEPAEEPPVPIVDELVPPPAVEPPVPTVELVCERASEAPPIIIVVARAVRASVLSDIWDSPWLLSARMKEFSAADVPASDECLSGYLIPLSTRGRRPSRRQSSSKASAARLLSPLSWQPYGELRRPQAA